MAVDGKRFDALAIALVDSESSRRTILQKLAGGGFAAAQAALGLTVFFVKDAEARSCKKKCKKKNTARKRRRCREKCGGATATGCATPGDCAGAAVCLNGICTNQCLDGSQCGSDETCENQNCVQKCAANSDCDSGDESCVLGACLVACQNDFCGGGEYCSNGGCFAQPFVQMCANPSDCDGEYECLEEICILSCAGSDNCPGDLQCNDDFICAGGSCNTNSDCNGQTTEICLHGNCVGAFPSPS